MKWKFKEFYYYQNKLAYKQLVEFLNLLGETSARYAKIVNGDACKDLSSNLRKYELFYPDYREE